MKRFRICKSSAWFLPGLSLLIILLLPMTAFAQQDCGITGSTVPVIHSGGAPLEVDGTYRTTLLITNNSYLSPCNEHDVRLEFNEVIFTPSCGFSYGDGKCNCADGNCDPGVFDVLATPTPVGISGTCAGFNFTASAPDPATGEVIFTIEPAGQPFTLGPSLSPDITGKTCEIEFYVKVVKLPTIDSYPGIAEECLQTSQLGRATLIEILGSGQDGDRGGGQGSSHKTFLCQPEITTEPYYIDPITGQKVPVTPGTALPIGTQLGDCATVTFPHMACMPSSGNGYVAFELYDPDDPDCGGDVSVFFETVPINSSGEACTTGTYPSQKDGIYHWAALYFEDPIECNNTAESGCELEAVEIYGVPCIKVDKDVNPKKTKRTDYVEYTLGPVCNCGELLLENVTIVDDKLGDLTNDFFGADPYTLLPGPPGQPELGQCVGPITKSHQIPADYDSTKTTYENTLKATGTPPVGDDVKATASASVELVVPKYTFTKKCTPKKMDLGDTIDWEIKFCNKSTGGVILNACITDNDVIPPVLGECQNVNQGDCFTITRSALTTAEGPISNLASAHITMVDPPLNNYWDTNAIDECEVVVKKLGCRITAGGITPDRNGDTDDWSDMDNGTFGGQVGAPCGCIGCFDEFNHIQGNWEHQRKSRLGNFHAKDYNSLVCGCDGVFDGELCNPGDRDLGPEPRRAPANMACFTGVGYMSLSGRRTIKVAFRVEVEDRGEPGAGKNAGPSDDVYRIRIWIPAVGEDAETLADLICCTYSDIQVRPPDIDDGGDIINGNIQIHPETPMTQKGICPPPDTTCPGQIVNTCYENSDCASMEYYYCSKPDGECEGMGICTEKPVECIQIWDPVCGCDGVTYPNECVSAAAGVSVDFHGECTP